MSGIEDVMQQVVELQSQMAFQEDTVTALNEALAGQQQEILVLRQQLALLKERQDEYAAALDQGGAAPAIEKPPHY
jgi:SlyX protein